MTWQIDTLNRTATHSSGLVFKFHPIGRDGKWEAKSVGQIPTPFHLNRLQSRGC